MATPQPIGTCQATLRGTSPNAGERRAYIVSVHTHTLDQLARGKKTALDNINAAVKQSAPKDGDDGASCAMTPAENIVSCLATCHDCAPMDYEWYREDALFGVDDRQDQLRVHRMFGEMYAQHRRDFPAHAPLLLVESSPIAPDFEQTLADYTCTLHQRLLTCDECSGRYIRFGATTAAEADESAQRYLAEHRVQHASARIADTLHTQVVHCDDCASDITSTTNDMHYGEDLPCKAHAFYHFAHRVTGGLEQGPTTLKAQ